MIAGSLIHGVYLGGVFFAVRHGLNAGIAALIVGLQPILTTILAARFLGERVKPRHMLGLALGLVGVALVILPKLDGEGAYGVLTLARCSCRRWPSRSARSGKSASSAASTFAPARPCNISAPSCRR